MSRFVVSFLPMFCLLIAACEAQTNKNRGLSLKWELLENQFEAPAHHKARFLIENQTGLPIEPGWKLYFNSIFFDLNAQIENPDVELKHLAGDFFVLTGKGKDAGIARGESLSITYRSRNPHLKNHHAPEAPIFSLANGTLVSNMQFEISEMSVWDMRKQAGDSKLPI
ncbi:MAG: hypothetical protein HWE09_15815, partial [Cyclobacteriaceae bacterium]|nr:hypothetical protein [Cyclobacteriaceae bacterium]